MADIENVALFPVYLPRSIGENEDRSDYDLSVGQNENYLNQNFQNLYNSLSELSATISSLQQKVGS